MNLKEVLEQTLAHVLDLMGLHAGVIRLAHQGGQEFRVFSGEGRFAAELESVGSVRICEEFVRAVSGAGGPIFLSDISDGRGALLGVHAIPNVRSAAGIPLVSKHRVVGVMIVFGQHTRAFSREEERWLIGLGHQVGVAVENASLFEETTAALARSNLLYELSNQLHSIQNVDEALRLAAQQIMEAFQADGTLILLDRSPLAGVTRCGTFLNGRRGAEHSSAPDPIARAVMDTGKPMLVTRAIDATELLGTSDLEEGVQALLAVPVQGASDCHGALVLSYRRPREFSPLEVETLVIFANHLGIALENARLYTAAQHQAERISAIYRLTKVISSSLDTDADTVYRAFAEEVKQVIPCERMGLVLSDRSGEDLMLFHIAADRPVVGEPWSIWPKGGGTGLEWVMSRRQPHVEEDLAKDRLFVEDQMLSNEGIRSCVRLPLIARGKVIGAFLVASTMPHSYSQGDLELLLPLVEQLAIAVENARLFREVNRLAVTDELTGLFNHRHFYSELQQEFRRAQRYDRPLSLIMLDIDSFKTYNDLEGHLAGDQVLRLIAGRLTSKTRRVDIAARYGGDEFGIILPETELRQAVVQAERIRAALEGFVPDAEGPSGAARITVSLGVACLGPHVHEAEDLVRAADQALYRSKAAGGNQISFA